MKKLSLILSIILIFGLTACVNRETYQPGEKGKEPEVAVEAVEPEEVPEEKEEEKPEEAPSAVEDPEEISEITGRVVKLLSSANSCNDVYQGNVGINTEAEPQDLGGEIYFLVDSEFITTIDDIEKNWNNTFVVEGKATELYEKMVAANIYSSINGQLHRKENIGDIPPITMGEWDTDSMVIKEVTEDNITVEMKTKLVGQDNGEKQLVLTNENGNWLLTDSYFLD